MQNGACYIRVSTDDQLEYSPTAQLKALKEYAKKNDIVLINEHIYIDEGISGRKAEKRPAFMKMIGTAKSKPKPFDVILVHKFDRFARSREDSVVYKSLLKKECNIRVVSITESIEDDKFSVILEAMLEAMAEYYSLNLSEEVKKGMTEKAHRGEFQSNPPFGYEMVNKNLVVIEKEARIVRMIFEKFANREMNMLQLAIYVNELGIKSKRGNPFENRTIDYILNNPVYIGKARWTPTGKIRRDFNNPDSIIEDSKHESLIDLDLWNKAQAAIKDSKEIYRRYAKMNTSKKSWLSGIVRCCNCGRTLVTYGALYMQCNGYLKGTCRTSCHIKKDLLESLVLEEIKKAYEGELEINIVPKSSDLLSKNELLLLTENLNRMESKESRIKTAYEDGIDTLEEYRENKKRLSDERKSLINKLNALQKKVSMEENGGITKKLTSVYKLLTDPEVDIEIKYKTAHFIIEQIIYNKKEKTLMLEYK